MSAPLSASMDTCDKKCKCVYGPYENQAYNCEKPCREGCSFSCDEGCDCGDNAGCWLIEVARSSTLGGWVNPGDVTGLYQNVPTGWDFGLWTKTTSLPSSGVNHFPVVQECTEDDVADGTCGAGLPVETFYSEFSGSTGLCFSSSLQPGEESSSGGDYNLRNPSGQKDEPIITTQDGSGQGVDYCNTDAITAEQDEESFPYNEYSPVITCRNPYAVYARVLRVNASGTNSGGRYFCDGGCNTNGFWDKTSVKFVELDYAEIDFFYGPSGGGVCGFNPRGGFLMNYRVAVTFNRTNTTNYSLGLFQGELIENSNPGGASLSIATSFTTDILAAKAELYIGPDFAPTPSDYNDIPEDFVLIDSKLNEDPNIYEPCLDGWT